MRWQYIAQQIVLLGAWGWLMRTAWREVREVMKEEKKHELGNTPRANFR